MRGGLALLDSKRQDKIKKKIPIVLSGGVRAEENECRGDTTKSLASRGEKSEGPGNGNAASQVSLPEIQ